MKTLTFTKLKKDFYALVNAGETIAITYGRKKEIVCYFNPQVQVPTAPKRRRG